MESQRRLKQLKADQLGLRHAVSQAVALNAPGGTIVLYVIGTAALMTFTFSQYPQGAFSIPLVLVLSLAIYVLMTFSMYEFSRYLSSSGGYYTFVTRGLGKRAGFVTALSYLSYQILSFTGFGLLGFIGFVYGIFPSLGVTIPYAPFLWIFIIVGMIGLVSFLIYAGIRPSMKVVSYIIAIEVVFFLTTSIYLLATNYTVLSPAPFTASPVGNDPLVLATMMVYAIGTFVGIGGSIPIAEETKNPKKNVPRAIMSTVVILGVTIIISSYAQVSVWGAANMGSFGTSVVYPVMNIYRQDFGALSILLYGLLLIIVSNSFFTATVSLGTNATRVLFSLSREGVLPRSLSRTREKNGTPTVAIALVAVISAVIVIVTGIVFEYLPLGNLDNKLLYASVFLLILESPIMYMVHILTNTSLFVYLRKNGLKVSYLKHLIIPSVSTITLIFAIVVAVYLNLEAPYIYGVYGSLVWIALIFVALLVTEVKYKHKLAELGEFSL